MKKIIFSLLLALIVSVGLFVNSQSVDAYTYVRGYYKSNGTYVSPHVRSSPNGIRYDNYSYSGGNLYNKTYASRSTAWSTPSWYTDKNYYTGLNLYKNNNYTKSNSTNYTSSFWE
jgi:hypothetical protein